MADTHGRTDYPSLKINWEHRVLIIAGPSGPGLERHKLIISSER
jgi:hypothetical protein